MPRPTLSRSERAAAVVAAVKNLPALVTTAHAAERQYGATDARTLRAWEAVEVNGATVHRQARLLAGKSRGG